MRVAVLLLILVERDNPLKFGTNFEQQDDWKASVYLQGILEVDKR